MAYINGEYNHPEFEITIRVLEPTKGENDYREGRRLEVEFDSFESYKSRELSGIIKWMKAVNSHISRNYDRAGKKNPDYQKFIYSSNPPSFQTGTQVAEHRKK